MKSMEWQVEANRQEIRKMQRQLQVLNDAVKTLASALQSFRVDTALLMPEDDAYLFQTTVKQRVLCAAITIEMADAGLSLSFIEAWRSLAENDAGVFGLGELWSEEDSEDERSELVTAIQNILDEDKTL